MFSLETLARLAQRPPLFERGPLPFWDDPYIAQQMLKAHLDPQIDAASRKPETIARTVAWITSQTGLQSGQRLLDLGCGPGLYARLFAAAGVHVTGVDLSENSLRYAREHDPVSTYLHQNYVDLKLDGVFDVIVLIYGDFCVLPDGDRDRVLDQVVRLLRPGGWFVLDVTTPRHHDGVRGRQEWDITPAAGFWKPGPHLVLSHTHDYPEHATVLDHYLVLEPTGAISEYRVWTHDYTLETITPVLEARGLRVESGWGDLTGIPYTPDSEWLGVLCRRP